MNNFVPTPPTPWIRPAQKQCGNCNRWMPKAKKVFKGIPFCESCYAREFHRVPCTRCKAPCRKHFTDYTSLCRSCIKDDRRCQRCERPVPRAALIVNDKPVCPSCRRHFKPAKLHRPVGYATCRVCRKYRFAVAQDDQCRPICRACNDNDRTEEVQAKELAYWSSSLQKRSSLFAVSLQQAWVVDLWKQFVAFEARDVGPKKLALKADFVLDFFSRLDERVERREDIDGRLLCSIFTGDELRRHWKALSFLSSLSIKIPTQVQKAEAIETQRIQRMLESIASSNYLDLIRSYVELMLSRRKTSGGPKLTTVRLNLRAAIGIADVAGAERLSQVHVDRYLRKQPGQRAALSGFVGFAGQSGYSVKIPPKKDVVRIKPQLIGQPTIRWFEGARSEVMGESAAAVIALLMHSLGVSEARLLSLDRDAVRISGERASLVTEDIALVLEESLGDAVQIYLTLRDNKFDEDGFLFPGRHKGQSMSAAGVNYHLSKWKTPVASIATPARQALKVQAAALPASGT